MYILNLKNNPDPESGSRPRKEIQTLLYFEVVQVSAIHHQYVMEASGRATQSNEESLSINV